MKYIGKLPSGKIFDQTKGKASFTFRLGVGEVIRGWDVGVEGMREGDKRTLIIPAAMGYGKKASRASSRAVPRFTLTSSSSRFSNFVPLHRFYNSDESINDKTSRLFAFRSPEPISLSVSPPTRTTAPAPEPGARAQNLTLHLRLHPRRRPAPRTRSRPLSRVSRLRALARRPLLHPRRPRARSPRPASRRRNTDPPTPRRRRIPRSRSPAVTRANRASTPRAGGAPPRARAREIAPASPPPPTTTPTTTRRRACAPFARTRSRARACAARARERTRARGTLALRGFGVFFSPAGARAPSSIDRSAHARATTPSNARRERETETIDRIVLARERRRGRRETREMDEDEVGVDPDFEKSVDGAQVMAALQQLHGNSG